MLMFIKFLSAIQFRLIATKEKWFEFDASDVLESYMYPAMARSFRTAGFQWATQFAYDPMATAYANTEYQTHYLKPGVHTIKSNQFTNCF